MKNFIIKGICSPQKHYMVDITRKANEIISLIDNEDYITISRPRQYGKTNLLSRLRQMLQSDYYVLSTSFQRCDSGVFSTNGTFVNYLTRHFADLMKAGFWPQNLIDIVEDCSFYGDDWVIQPLTCLESMINRLCSASDRGIVLMIDEADLITNNDVLLNFLGILRANYLQKTEGLESSFQSVILAGVTDITNLKDKIRPHSEHDPNSPWNIAVDLSVDMSFSAEEIAGMLSAYDKDHHTGMDIAAVSEEIRRLTAGYPFIVSWICMWLDTEGRKNWSVEGVRDAGKAFLRSRCTLLNSIRGKVSKHKDLRQELIDIIFYNRQYTFDPPQPPTELGIIYGILAEGKNNCVMISNPLFEEYLKTYIVDFVRTTYMGSVSSPPAEFVADGRLNMVHVLDRFQAFLAGEFRESDSKFIEKQGRLLFLGFLKPIINGTGHTYTEPQTAGDKRMDVVVSYGIDEHIVELKIWEGPAYRESGIQQLEGYMDSREANIAYLVSFSFTKSDRSRRGWLSPEETRKQIYEVVIQLGRQ